MDTKLDIGRLSTDELEYELKIRGVSESAPVEVMRRTLRRLVRFANSASFVLPPYPFTFAEDATAIEAKIASINDFIRGFVGSRTSSGYQKISTSISHAIGRVNRSTPKTDEEQKQRSQFLVRLVDLMSQLTSIAKLFEKSSTNVPPTVLDLSTINNSNNRTSTSSDDSDEEIPSRASREHVVKPVPVSSWGLKFSGDPKTLSLGAFLERVGELRLARNSSDELIFRSAIDLFSGPALTWYRANRDSFASWQDVVVGLRAEFQSHDFDERLFEEIKRRTQGPQESIGMYLAAMKNLFSRLSTPVPESTQLTILLRNLHPFYQTPLGLVEVTSIGQLLTLGRKLEAKKATVEAYVPPPSKHRSMEPDLAYMDVTSNATSRAASSSANPRTPVKCWNCEQIGHLASRCDRPPRMHCYKCGEPGVTVRNCRKCSLNSGGTR